jgi:hypothetical protein
MPAIAVMTVQKHNDAFTKANSHFRDATCGLLHLVTHPARCVIKNKSGCFRGAV